MVKTAEEVSNFSVLHTLDNIRRIFQDQIDQSWFVQATDGLPIQNVKELRDLMTDQDGYEWDLKRIQKVIALLDSFILQIKNDFLPVIKERLNISSLFPDYMIRDKVQVIKRKLLAQNFPYNIKNLEELTLELKDQLGPQSNAN